MCSVWRPARSGRSEKISPHGGYMETRARLSGCRVAVRNIGLDSHNCGPSTPTYDKKTNKLRPSGHRPRTACTRHAVDGYEDTGVIRRCRVAVWNIGLDSYNCGPFTPPPNKKTNKMRPSGHRPRTACTRHAVDGYEDTGMIRRE
jgi:hypothetical protein